MSATQRRLRRSIMVGMWVLILAARSEAVIPYWTPTRATNPPQSCYYADSGWQYQGQWGAYLGTPIAPNYFVTAKHVNGAVGNTFTYNGQPYTTVNSFASPNSDLRIWEVSTPFSSYAMLYTASTEVGQKMTFFGRGTPRGSAVVANGQTKGWRWGTTDHVQSWGSNDVESIQTDPTYGQLLYFDFSATGDWYEGALSVGDSGGGVFIKDNDVWKLAGINLAVDGRYSLTGQNGSGFDAAIFDARDLYYGGNDNWSLIPGTGGPMAMGSYATRISSNYSWIASITGPLPAGLVPEPASVALLLLACGFVWRRRVAWS